MAKINRLRMERSINLEGTVGAKPCINDMIDDIAEEIYSRRGSYVGRGILSNVRDWCADLFGYDRFADDEEDWEYDDYACRSPRIRGRKGRRGGVKSRKRRNKSASKLDWSEGELFDAAERRVANCMKRIIFYKDIYHGDSRDNVLEFSTLKSFNDFCERRGYDVLVNDAANLSHWDEIHCCIDPYIRNCIMTERSYGALMYTVDPDGGRDYTDYDY